MKAGTASAIVAQALAAALAACSPESFDSATPITSAVLGMSWSEATAIEPRPAAPDLADPRTVAGFDVASSGSAIHVGGAFYSSFSGRWEGSIVRWTPAEGWSGAGTLSRSITSSEGFEHVAGARGPGETALFAFGHEDGAGASDQLVTARYQDGAWDTEKSALVTDLPVFPASTSATTGLQPRLTADFDPLGRAVFGMLDASGSAQALLWEGSAADGIRGGWDSVAGVLSGGAHSARATAVSDGTTGNCLVYEMGDDDDRDLAAACLDFSGITEVYADTLVPGGIRGHAAASDGEGCILVVAQYAVTAGAFSLIGFTITDGEPDDSATTVSVGMPTGLRAAPIFEDGAYEFDVLPEVVHLGGGNFLVAWIGVGASGSAGLGSQVFARTYEAAAGTWGSLVELSDYESYAARPHHQSISLFSNEAGDAAIAINHVRTEGAAAADDVHDVLVRRYNTKEGWLTTGTAGLGCSGSLRECTRRPRGAILDTGEAAVAFIDQDEDGLYRLKATTFSAE